MHISKESNLVTLINVFETTPEKQQALIDQWVRFTEEVRNEPGYVGTALHKSTDGTRVINYAHWRSQADFDAFLKSMEQTLPSSARTPRASIPIPTTSSISMIGQKRIDSSARPSGEREGTRSLLLSLIQCDHERGL